MGQDRVKASGFLPSPCVSQELLTSWEPLLWKPRRWGQWEQVWVPSGRLQLSSPHLSASPASVDLHS